MPEKDNKYFQEMIAVRDNTATPFMLDNGFVVNEPHVDPNREVRLDDGVMGFVPVVGDVLSAAQIGLDLADKKYMDAAIGAGMFFLPGALKKGGRKVADAIYDIATKENVYKSAKKLYDKNAAFRKYMDNPHRKVSKAMRNLDIDGIIKQEIDYQTARNNARMDEQLNGFTIVSGKDEIDEIRNLPFYETVANTKVRPATRMERYTLDSEGLEGATGKSKNAVAYNDPSNNEIVFFKPEFATNNTLAHEFRHGVQDGFGVHYYPEKVTLATKTSDLYSPLVLDGNPEKLYISTGDMLEDSYIKRLIDKYNAGLYKDKDDELIKSIDILRNANNGNWKRSLTEFDAEYARMRNLYGNKPWKQFAEEKDPAVDKILDYISDRFNISKDDADFILSALYNNGYKDGGDMSKVDSEAGDVPFMLQPLTIPAAVISEPVDRKIDKLFWHGLMRPRDYSKEQAGTEHCAQWSNRELRKMGYDIWGDAWTRTNNPGLTKVISGYDGLTRPEKYKYSDVKEYLLDAADNVKKGLDWRDLQEGDMVGMYFRTSPSLKKAYEQGANGEAQTHTGHVVYRNGKPYVVHNVHGDVIMNKAKKVIGRNHPWGIVSVYRPSKKHANGGRLSKPSMDVTDIYKQLIEHTNGDFNKIRQIVLAEKDRRAKKI